jgi:hypothetical protein
VRAFRTAVSISQHGLRALTDVDANVIGCVLNAVDYRKASSHYYQYYAYRNEGYRPEEIKGGESVAPSAN